ncbi:hypothetical protein MBLNU457_g2560t1 [Dothideomycetes sp. NU457]
MATIQAIKDSSIHQIQSGQVIVDLNSVVKELVENSLDAGATSIDVRFKNHGLDSIEVQDNGNGISEEDYETIALKHYTSKLSSYEDLTSLDTFGFRGEALSSLCALSDFHITTAKAGAGAKGTRLDFEISGKLKGTGVVAAPKGTTVSVENLFKNLPVRRKELEKNIKREYGKVLGLLHAYACISVGVRFSVSSQMPKAKKVPVFSTKGNPTTRENIVNVFGSKTLVALVKLDLKLEMQPSLGPTTQSARTATQSDERTRQVQIHGHISRPTFGEGRQAPDRQMFFVNSRPCGLPQVSKAFNEVYKSFNVSQSPFIFANLVMDTNAYDVNVSPDKRTIMLHDQTALLEALKTELSRLFESVDQSVPASQLAPKKLPAFQPLNVTRKPSLASESSQVSENARSPSAESGNPVGNGSPVNLIAQWVGRDADSRHATPQARAQKAGPSRERLKLVDAIARRRSESEADDTVEEGRRELHAKEDEESLDKHKPQHPVMPKLPIAEAPQPQSHPLSSAYDDIFSQRPPPLRRDVQDFNARIASQKAKHLQQKSVINTETVDLSDEEDQGEQNDDDQRPMGDRTRTSSGGALNAFDRMKTKRTPSDIAQDKTVGRTSTRTDETPASKKRRIYEPKDTQSIAKFGASPLLARSLRRFTAPGTQVSEEGDDFDVVGRSPEDDPDIPEDEPQPSAHFMTHTQALEAEDGASVEDLDEEETSAIEDAPFIRTPFIETEDSDDEYLDEEDKKIREDAKIARMIQEAEEISARPTNENLKRASQILRARNSRREATVNLMQTIQTSTAEIASQVADLTDRNDARTSPSSDEIAGTTTDGLEAPDAESKLSLTISKNDFLRMRIVGQFNLGFILAVRPATEDSTQPSSAADQDHTFIIDQHAADEKFNFERLTRTTTLEPQRLVQPKPLELTAVEEEIILSNSAALVANGFELVMDESGDLPVGQRCKLLSLPTSKEKTFTLSDLEELIHLLSETVSSGNEIPRPTKVRKMLAMRACRSSIMVGKTLPKSRMEKVVRNMGEMEKPWNCPHGRPTMRHLAGLGAWSGWNENSAWEEGDNDGGGETDWLAYLNGNKEG